MTAFLLALIYLTAADNLTGKVVRIADGDTVTILVGGNQVRVRLFGIDAPERGQDYSRKSSDALADLVFGKEVRVVVHDKDRYGRTVPETNSSRSWMISTSRVLIGAALTPCNQCCLAHGKFPPKICWGVSIKMR